MKKIVLIPQPQKLTFAGGSFNPPARGVIGIADQRLYPTANLVRRLFKSCRVTICAPCGSARALKLSKAHTAGPATVVGSQRSDLTDTLSIRLSGQPEKDGYELRITPGAISIEADSVAAAFWAAQTLMQIHQQNPARLPCLRIRDWPDIPDRGLYYDVCRGRVPKLERLMELADQLSKYKINQLQLYIEHTFAFRGHPDIGKGASPLTAEDILKLDAFCRERHIELVPSLASFGHLATVLKHPQYHHLAEDWGKGKYVTPDKKMRKWLDDWIKRCKETAFTLSPANPKIYQFLDSLFAEFLPLFSSKRFNVCCDETYDLGYGQSYQLCQKIGRGRLYLGHIIRLNELAGKYGKRLMFWGDIIRKYPRLIPKIPKDVTVLDWGYAHDRDFGAIRDFKKSGLEFYGCPSVSGYYALFPRLRRARANIAGFAAACRKYGARGLLNTDWGDDGHYNFMELTWHGYLFGAEQSWNVKANQEDFTERFCRLFMNIADRRFSAAVDELGRISDLYVPPFYQSVWRHLFFSGARRPVWKASPQKATFVDGHGCIREGKIALNAGLGNKTAKKLDAIREVFSSHVGMQGRDPLKVLPYWIFAVDTLRHAARKLEINAPDGRKTAIGLNKLRREHAALRKRFISLWMARNRRSEIGITLKAYHEARSAEMSFQDEAKQRG